MPTVKELLHFAQGGGAPGLPQRHRRFHTCRSCESPVDRPSTPSSLIHSSSSAPCCRIPVCPQRRRTHCRPSDQRRTQGTPPLRAGRTCLNDHSAIDTATLGDTILERVMTALAPISPPSPTLQRRRTAGAPIKVSPPPTIPLPPLLPTLPPCQQTCLKLVWHSTIFRPSHRGHLREPLRHQGPVEARPASNRRAIHSGSRQLPPPARTGDERY